MARKLECSSCGQPKEQVNTPYCSECRRKYRAAHYQENKPAYFAKAKAQRVRNREFISSMKQRPCTDCGIQYQPWQMTFDHLPGTIKLANVAQLHVLAGRAGILEEVAKCEVVCFNCHADRTYRRAHQETRV